ncbi:hypothetical protein FA039_26985 [Escherichia coli]|nr:hypothetical protein [Escherichia coli]
MVLFWTVLGSVGALPFLLGKPEPHDYRCVFESFSGLTTTGTIAVGWLAIPPISSAWVGCSSIAQKCPAR